MLNLVVLCEICNEPHDVNVNQEDYTAWRKRVKLAQDAFPYLSADERELLISHTCPSCWSWMYGDESF